MKSLRATFTAALLVLAFGAAQANAGSEDCDGVCTATGPDTTVTSGPSRITTDRLPQFTFEAPGASGFRCSLGGEPFFDCSSPYTPDLPILSDGDYGFTVFALGPDGKYHGGKMGTWQFELVTEPPQQNPPPDDGTPPGDGTPPPTDDGTPPIVDPPADGGGPSTLPPPTPQCIVPKVKGKRLAAARAALKQATCRTGKVTKRHGRRGYVLKQSLRPGVAVVPGTRINLVVGR